MSLAWFSPKFWYHHTSYWRYFIGLFCILLVISWYWGIAVAPRDRYQLDAYRIIYIHVPAAFLSLAAYTLTAMMSLIFLIWRITVADHLAVASAKLGMLATAIALITGSIWGKPIWGTWWVWDARLTSELMLFLLYAGYLLLNSKDLPKLRAARAGIAVVGVIDLPIIHYSVNWWTTLHQKSTLLALFNNSMDFRMLFPLISNIIAWIAYYCGMMLLMVQNQLLSRRNIE